MNQSDFLLYLPFQYRTSILIVLGIWLWYAALYLYKPLPRLISYDNPAGDLEDSTTTTAATWSLVILTSILLSANGISSSFPLLLPQLTLAAVILALFPIRLHIPGLIHPHARSTVGKSRFASTMRRICIGGLAKREEERFGDVLAADALCSYMNTFEQVAIAIAMIVPGISRPSDVPTLPLASVILPLLRSWPYLIRFRQCLAASQPANALKYSTTLLQIALYESLKHASTSQLTDTGIANFSLTMGPALASPDHYWRVKLWLASALLSSTYSLYWDLTQDWDIPLLLANVETPPWRVWVGVVLTCVGRFTWTFATSGLGSEVYVFKERTVFVMEIFEKLRRGWWVVLRAETEGLRKRERGAKGGGMFEMD